MKKSYFFLVLLLLSATFSSTQAITLTGKLVYSAGCDSQLFRVTASGYSSTMRLVTYFGDGSSKIDTFFSNTPYRTYTTHHFATPGVYTVKHVLTLGGVPVDSMSYPDTVIVCRHMHIMSYMDNNSNCIYDAGDSYLPLPFALQIDSAGVHIDTLVATSFNYVANNAAPPGTIYTFTVLTNPLNRHVICPASGIIRDTLGTSTGQHRLGFTCDSTGFDLGVYGWFRGGVTGACAHVYAYNVRCAPQAATVTLNYSPKYAYSGVYPSTVSVTTGSGYVTLNMGTPAPFSGCIVYFTPVGTPSLGDTTHTTWTVNPISGDARPSNNTLYRVDSIRTAYDPNDKTVTPEGLITAGSTLDYKIGFENLGSDTAFNIHIMDTLSDYLDVNTLRLTGASADVYTQIYNWNGHNIVKFDLPNIRLLDTTHAGKNTGVVSFTVNIRQGVADGTVITNKAGIYFDANPVVMTNNTYNTIGRPTGVNILSNNTGVMLYPNPVTSELMVTDKQQVYVSWQLTDVEGRTIQQGNTTGKETRISMSALAPGLYQLLLRNSSGAKAFKVEKD